MRCRVNLVVQTVLHWYILNFLFEFTKIIMLDFPGIIFSHENDMNATGCTPFFLRASLYSSQRNGREAYSTASWASQRPNPVWMPLTFTLKNLESVACCCPPFSGVCFEELVVVFPPYDEAPGDFLEYQGRLDDFIVLSNYCLVLIYLGEISTH